MSDEGSDDIPVVTIAELGPEEVSRIFGVSLETARFMIAMEKGDIGPDGDMVIVDEHESPE